MNRSARLQSARAWLEKYKGKNVALAYRKHFGVDWMCAFTELGMLGIKIDSDYKSKVLRSAETQIAAHQRRKARQEEVLRLEEELFDRDENFAYIVGYTPAGFPYGVTWEEWEGFNEGDFIDPD
jgi:hypothetical protein